MSILLYLPIVLTDWFLFAPNCLRIAPPLTITEDELKLACRITLEEIDKLQNQTF